MYVNLGVEMVHNGMPTGQVGRMLQGVHYDPGLLRPFIMDDPSHPYRGRPCVTVNTGRTVYDNKLRREVPVYRNELIANLQARGINSPVFNATSLRKEEWIMLDQVVIRAARLRPRAWADLAGANTYGGFNGMSKLILEHETMSDPGEAVMDMNGLTPGRQDSPKFQLEGLPLPITHSDFTYDARRLAVSRNTGTPLDTTMGEAAGRRVAEMVEKVTIGVDTGLTYGGNSTQVGGYGRTSSVYGYLNFPARLTKTNLYKPTGVGRSGTGWTPLDTIKDVLAMRDALFLNKFYGPFMLYHSNDWDQYMDGDYFTTSGSGSVSGLSTKTLRQRLRAIGSEEDASNSSGPGEQIAGVRRLDFLTAAAFESSGPARITTSNPWALILVQMTPDVARAVVGMDITTVQWEQVGGMQLNFKVMTIAVPQLRADFNGNCGILTANASTGV